MDTLRNILSGALVFPVLLSGALGCGGSDKKTDLPVDSKVEEALVQDSRAPMEHRARMPQMDDDEGSGGMEVEGLRGHLDPYDIRKGVEAHSTALAACYHSKAKRQSYLGGEVVLAFVVARDGSVKEVRTEKSSVGSWEVEECLLQESLQMTFPKPKGGDAEFTLPLEFEARRTAHWWPEEKAEAEIGELSKELKACRKEVKVRDPRNVWVTFYLGNRGVVKSVGFASPHKKGIPTEWAQCAVEKVMAWTLNDPRGNIVKLGFRYNPE